MLPACVLRLNYRADHSSRILKQGVTPDNTMKSCPGKDYVFSESHRRERYEWRTDDYFDALFMNEKYKMITYGGKYIDLFDRIEDPGNHKNLVSRPEYQNIITEMKARLSKTLQN